LTARRRRFLKEVVFCVYLQPPKGGFFSGKRKRVIIMQDRIAENSKRFVPPQERLVQPGLADLHEGRPVANGNNVRELPSGILVGRVDTTRQTLK
jgi:hypothetical protein